MPKVFDMVHKVSDQESSTSRIPFEDDNKTETRPAKSRPRVEIIFFYILLFVIFFIMGAAFLSPDLLSGLFGASRTAEVSPNPIDSPAVGLTIEKEGQSPEEAAAALGTKKTSSATVTSPEVQSTPPPQVTTASTAARIQVLNGTNRTGAAAAMRLALSKAGIVVTSIGNYHKRTVSKTTIFYNPAFATAAKQVQAVSGGVLAPTTSGIGSNDVLLVIGTTK